MNRVAVLGSSGSIGTNCLEVIAAHPERLQAVGLSVNQRWDVLVEQSRRFRPRWAVVADEACQAAVRSSDPPQGTEWSFGSAAIERLAGHPDVDTVVCGIVGAAGLRSAWAAVETGKRVAIANKETLVVAGPLVTQLALRTGAKLLPVDSEHSAVFQALQCRPHADTRHTECADYTGVSRIVLTASGGPFRGWSRERLKTVTVEQALAHPTWNMGPKITIDSATMMNKALEIIEARWLFGLEPDQIGVVIHPQSIVHSMVEFVDGSTIAQLSPPDMKLPIQYALTFPERWNGISPRMDWSCAAQLTFEPPDFDAFPALRLGFEVARRGGTAGAVLNAANEVAVERFLAGTLRFDQIAAVCRTVLEHHTFDANPTLSGLLEQDAWARKETLQWN